MLVLIATSSLMHLNLPAWISQATRYGCFKQPSNTGNGRTSGVLALVADCSIW